MLKNKSILITGGTSGIGLAAAQGFLEKGAKVMITGRSEGKGRQAVTDLGSPTDLFFHPCDVRSSADVETLFREASAKLGRVDVLVNSAGIYLEKRLEDTSEIEWDAIIETNLKGIYLCCREAYRHFRQYGGGVIVNVSSDDGLKGEPSCAAYCASKGAVSNLTRAMALDWSAEGIRVNAVCPGVIDTPLTAAAVDEQENKELYVREMNDLHPIGRIGRPEEAAAAILFLASDDASFITGANLAVDGGTTAG